MNMDRLKISTNTFLPSFTLKLQHLKCISLTKKQKLEPKVKLSSKICKELCLFNNTSNSASSKRILRYKNQNNSCEFGPLIMTPLRLTNAEIYLPDASNLSNTRVRTRKIYTAINRRKSVEDKSSNESLIKFHVGITSSRHSAKPNGSNSKSIEIKRINACNVSKSGQFSHILIKNYNTKSVTNYSPNKAISPEKHNHSNGLSTSSIPYSTYIS